jgi:hypothetical protein
MLRFVAVPVTLADFCLLPNMLNIASNAAGALFFLKIDFRIPSVSSASSDIKKTGISTPTGAFEYSTSDAS